MSPEHHPDGDPCSRCALPAARHRIRRGRPDTRTARKRKDTRRRPTHEPDARLCSCGVRAELHRPRAAARSGPRPPAGPRTSGRHGPRPIIGIDGEGVGRKPHRYIYLAACDATGQRVFDVRAKKGERLTTRQCFDLILSLPADALIVGFAFAGYDATKILTDIPDSDLYALMHPDLRRNESGRPVPIQWRGYRVNFQNRTLTVARGKHRRSVHDVFKFYQCSFVKALEDWKVATADELARMRKMKADRSTFREKQRAAIESYCRDECSRLAQLVRKLLDAHEEAGIKLQRYDGPGSSATVLLKRMGVLDHLAPVPPEMDRAVKCGFFGGRFEHARVGAVHGRIWEYDLASAYPYAATALPCLAHGDWRLVEKPSARVLDRATLALVKWSGGAPRSSRQPWGALPVRTEDGCIIFPLGGVGGWVWLREFRSALAFGDYKADAAWVFSGCDCDLPFAQLADVYRERVKLGKDGPGKVLKLASNSVPGKTMQSVGKAPFRSLVWGGLITSDTRAELLDATALDPDAVVAHATDGIKSTRRLKLRAPRDTGTAGLVGPDGKPAPLLGEWEEKTPEKSGTEHGIFLVRPGIYFPLGDKRPKDLRARGIAKSALLDALARIVRAQEAGKRSVVIRGMQRFIGAKSALHLHKDGSVARSEGFGEWLPHSVDLTFNPHPKRVRAVNGRLLTWAFLDFESEPYETVKTSPDAAALGRLDEINGEQPDGEIEGA